LIHPHQGGGKRHRQGGAVGPLRQRRSLIALCDIESARNDELPPSGRSSSHRTPNSLICSMVRPVLRLR